MTSILCIGDFGCGNDNQRRVAYLMEQLCKKEDVAFILGLGDNIYPDGTVSIYDPKFDTHFEDPYKNLPKDIKFYHCLGNHDYRGSIESQIMYSNYSNRWVLPDNYYCFHGKVNNIECDFFAIDTNLYLQDDKIKQKEHESWLIEQIENSNKKWKIVFGHHPWKSTGSHGDSTNKLDKFYKKITSELDIDIILSGHDHDQQHLYIPDKPHLFISGTGSKMREYNIDERLKAHPRYLQFFTEQLGCLKIVPTEKYLEINMYAINNENEYNNIYSFKIIKKNIS